MKKTLYLVVITMLVFMTMGCYLLDILGLKEYDFKFVNDSSYDVMVEPNGQDGWIQFLLVSSSSRTVTIHEDRIRFVYSPAYLVEAESEYGTGVITFVDIYY